jgi:phosphoribosylaminoimidazolecarboxamide formyltransferase/IMP cyclohydrolase
MQPFLSTPARKPCHSGHYKPIFLVNIALYLRTTPRTLKEIKSALISVYHKDNLAPIIEALHRRGITIYSTGGTEAFIQALGVTVIPVESLTNYPSILGGRVKTLHPKIFGGILGRRSLDSDVAQLETYEIPSIDLVVVDLYPFEATVEAGGTEGDIIEKIDIGGISLIRAAAKNFTDVVIVPSMQQYPTLLHILEAGNAITTLAQRRSLAAAAFDVSSHYDAAIYRHFAKEDPSLKISEPQSQNLRYGENPHQRGKYYGNLDHAFEFLHGKELSYNNLLDVDAAVQLMAEFQYEAPTFAILKHNNACGVATRPTLREAYLAALAGDPTSAFGGILIANSAIDEATAAEIHQLFCEVVIAPHFSDQALALLQQKKNRILLRQKQTQWPTQQVRSALNGFLWQERDTATDTESTFTYATHTRPNQAEVADLIFASKIAKHTKSNTIVLAKGLQLLGSGTGQTSRVDALEQAIAKALKFGFDLRGAAMASDAFFPFPDCVEIAHQAGITTVIQPGGSVKDQLSINYCNENSISMVTTGTRHFKH